MAILIPSGTPVLGTADVVLWRGVTHPRPIWLFDMDLTGSVLVLRVHWDGSGFEVSSAPGETPEAGELEILRHRDVDRNAPAPPYAAYRNALRWTPPPALTLSLPYGRIARFQIERQIRAPGGERRVYREGYFVARGLPDD